MLRILPESRCLCLHRRGWWTGCRWWRPGQSATRGWCWPGSWACWAPRTRPWWSQTRSSPAGRGTWCSRLRRRCPPPGEASPGQSSVSAAAAAWPGSGGLLGSGSGSHLAKSLSLTWDDHVRGSPELVVGRVQRVWARHWEALKQAWSWPEVTISSISSALVTGLVSVLAGFSQNYHTTLTFHGNFQVSLES